MVESYPDRFQVATLAAGNNAELAFEQAVRWKPLVLSLAREQDAEALGARLRGAALGWGCARQFRFPLRYPDAA